MRLCTPLIDDDTFACSLVDSVVDVSISFIMLIMAVIFVTVCVCVCVTLPTSTRKEMMRHFSEWRVF